MKNCKLTLTKIHAYVYFKMLLKRLSVHKITEQQPMNLKTKQHFVSFSSEAKSKTQVEAKIKSIPKDRKDGRLL